MIAKEESYVMQNESITLKEIFLTLVFGCWLAIGIGAIVAFLVVVEN